MNIRARIDLFILDFRPPRLAPENSLAYSERARRQEDKEIHTWLN
jgi:hypothetical protein